jgi:cytochrome c-type biogenesis protein CcmH
MKKWMLSLLFALALPLSALANEAAPAADDPVLEKRVMALAEELRCLVCQNQSLADSHADLAADLKNQIREQMRQGKRDKEIVDYLVARYGDFVLYRPPVKSTTWLLWFGPALLLAAGLAMLAVKLRQRRRQLEQEPQPSPEELRQAASLLAETEQKEQA